MFLIGVVAALVLFGLLMVYSSSYIFSGEKTGDGFALIKRQGLFVLLGVPLAWVVSHINYRTWYRVGYWVLLASLILVALVYIPGLGTKVGGAQRWIRMGFLNMQPSEFAKLAVVMFVAMQLERKRDRLHRFQVGVLSNFLLPLPILLMLLLQPDFGSVVIISGVLFALMFLAGVALRHLALTALVGVSGFALLMMSSSYRRARFMSFLDPWEDPAGRGFQILQSLTGLFNGQSTGVGLGNGKSKLFFLPEAHNDFILAVIGEELGFIGMASVAVAFAILVYRGFRIAWGAYSNHGDRFGLYLGAGVTLLLGGQAFINMAVVLGMLPTKGLNLPFVSYGGSALLANLVGVGILLSIARGPHVPPLSVERLLGRMGQGLRNGLAGGQG